MKLGLDIGNTLLRNHNTEFMPGIEDYVFPWLVDIFGKDNICLISRTDKTTRSPDTLPRYIKRTEDFLKQHDFIWSVVEGKIDYCFERQEKAQLAKNRGLTHFVDDRTEVLAHMDGIVPIKIGLSPKQEDIVNFPPEKYGIQIAKTWDDVIVLIHKSLKE